MPTGKVKFWNDARAYGFITRDDEPGDIFVHLSALAGSAVRLIKRQKVEFEPCCDPRTGKLAAKNVRVI